MDTTSRFFSPNTPFLSPAPKTGDRPQLDGYTDFRAYLRDFFEYKKRILSSPVRPYTYSAFSAAADIKSPNYLKLIIEGQRNLSSEMMRKFAKALGLSKAEGEEFYLLVEYGQAQDPLDRNRRLKALSEFRVQRQIKQGRIKTTAWDKVPNWVTWVLYTLVDQDRVRFDIAALRKTLRGWASVEEIKRSLKRLVDHGELVSAGEGYRKGRVLMEGSEEIPAEMVRKLQSELIYLGLESLHRDPAADREFGALTLALTEEEFENLKFELRQLRKRISKDIGVKREQSKGKRVYQLNLQLFPMTEAGGEENF